MAVAKRFLQTGEATGEVDLPGGTFGIEPNGHVMWEAVRNYLANQRQGTACVKSRGEKRGGGRKPWRQKGTGRARCGTIRSPIRVGGARAFGPKPRDYSYAVPKKVKRLALQSALSSKAQAGDVVVISDFQVSEGRTREVAGMLKGLGLTGTKCLLVLPEHDPLLARATRNLPDLRTLEFRLLNTYEILQAGRLLIMESAVAKIGEAWS
ncbi:MAG: 50S ribosomal protein L4 [Candidatus Eisenbacteria sp.]|nr:50S ribosomal protein L4 [Candidatus Eisenbacteria bacterium]